MEIRLSSYKKNFGLENILSADGSTYWSSDGNLPHVIELIFDEIEYVHHIQLFLSFLNDDSYTPEKIDIICGLSRDRMVKVKTEIFQEPEGCMPIYIKEKVRFIYLVIRSNHQEGRDTHIRQIRVMKSENLQFYTTI